MIDPEELIGSILKLSWPDLSHEEVKLRLGTLLEETGFSVTFEYSLKRHSRNWHIDVVASDKGTGFKIGIEIDRATPKLKSVEKLRELNPDLALMILRTDQIPEHKIWQRVRRIPFSFAVLNLSKKCIVFSNLP